jgi:hypothetical protein
LKGSVAAVRGRRNKAFYEKETSPVQVIVEKRIGNKRYTGLLAL